MSYYDYISFPRELNAYYLSDIRGNESKYGINYETKHYREDILLFPNSCPEDSNIVIISKRNAKFKDCFKNVHIYGLCVSLALDEEPLILQDCDEHTLKMIKARHEKAEKQKLALYNLIQQNINRAEFVEIYSEFTNHINFNLSPPETEFNVGLNDLLSYCFPKRSNKQKIIINANLLLD